MKITDEDKITAQIEMINYLLDIVCDELNGCKEIDDYEIELNEGVITTCLDERPERKYKIITTIKTNLQNGSDKE